MTYRSKNTHTTITVQSGKTKLITQFIGFLLSPSNEKQASGLCLDLHY